ncbi:DUF429 domain-containing protein [Ornithinimicrobium sp. W1679]|uniref:DUF429 domain-containing protein n=1 Tax=Ornithinimicrobium sp. W1679 TaxID=3418770 RepID=UPI003CF2890C
MGLTEWWNRLTGKGAKKPGVEGRGSRGAGGGSRPRGTTAPEAARGRTATGGTMPRGRPGRRPSAPDPARPVLGLDVARGGWVGALLEASGHGTPMLLTGATAAEVVQKAGEVAVVAVDIPVGLPDDARREADVQTRAFLPGKASSVFTTPVREAVYAESYGQANAVNRERVGSGVSQQAFELRRRIKEVDAWVREDLPFLVAECHPEASFAMMAGTPLTSKKKSAEGAAERRDTLARQGIYVPTTAPTGVGTDDMLDACAAAWTAHRVKTGQARTFPEAPQTFSDGIPAAIHV